MATVVKHRRGSTEEVLSYTPKAGELIWDTESKSIHMGDGFTEGGHNQRTDPLLTLSPLQSDSGSGLIRIVTRTTRPREVYEVRKSHNGALATIYSDESGTAIISQNGLSNKSGLDKVVEFYISEGSYYISVTGDQYSFITTLRTEFSSLEDAKNYTGLPALVGEVISTGEYHTGTGYGGSTYYVVDSNTVTPNGIYIIDCGGGIALSLKIRATMLLTKFGVLLDGSKGATDYNNTVRVKAAFSIEAVREYVMTPEDRYLVCGDAVLPTRKTLRGEGHSRIYNPYGENILDQFAGHCTIVYDTDYPHCINFEDLCKIRDLNFYGVNRSCYGISQETRVDGIFADNVSMTWFSGGFASAYSMNNCRLLQCHAAQNNSGIRNLVDSRVIDSEINANESTGINMQAGANDNTFVANKVEWNGGDNWKFFNNRNNNVIGGICDRAGVSGFSLIDCKIQITDVNTRRNGRSVLGDDKCAHYYIAGGGADVTISSMATYTGADDDGGGDVTPNYTISMVESTVGSLNLIGGNATGFTSQALRQFSTPSIYKSTSVIGMDDYSNEGLNQEKQGKRGLLVSRTTVSSGATSSLTIPSFGISEYTADRFNVRISNRNESSSSVDSADFIIAIGRSGGNAAIKKVALVFETTAGSYGVASEAIVLSATVNEDGTELYLDITNNSGATQKLTIQAE